LVEEGIDDLRDEEMMARSPRGANSASEQTSSTGGFVNLSFASNVKARAIKGRRTETVLNLARKCIGRWRLRAQKA
jgi:hypothetical protein